MTITQDSSAPLVAVVGATGKQGGSVFKALAESDKAYRIRAFTRDSAKPAARALAALGVDIVVVSLLVDNKEAVYKAFAGADYAFLVTNFWEHADIDKEVDEGKLLIDAAKAGGVKGIVWSGLPSFDKLSNGKYTHVLHFEGKALVTAYGRTAGVPFAEVQAGAYGTNFLKPPSMPVKQPDGTYAMSWPVESSMVVPFIDVENDYGVFVRHVLEMPVFPDGGEFVAYGENITVADVTVVISKGTGKTVKYQQIPLESFEAGIAASGLPPHLVQDMVEFSQAWNEFGWKAETNLADLPRRPRTFAEYVQTVDWSKVLV